jgi:hypothetical protein
VAGRGLLSLTDDLDDFVAHRGEVDVKALQRLRSDSLTLVEQPEKDVLCAYVIVIQKTGFFLSQNYDSSCPVCKALKHSLLLHLATRF